MRVETGLILMKISNFVRVVGIRGNILIVIGEEIWLQNGLRPVSITLPSMVEIMGCCIMYQLDIKTRRRFTNKNLQIINNTMFGRRSKCHLQNGSGLLWIMVVFWPIGFILQKEPETSTANRRGWSLLSGLSGQMVCLVRILSMEITRW